MLLLAVLELSACFYVRLPPTMEPETPIPGFDAGKYQVHKLVVALGLRDKSLDSMQTPAIMEYTSSTQHLKAREEIAVKRPDNLRVEAMSPLGVALLLTAQGPQLAVFEPGANRFMRGAATADTLYRYVRIPMAPADAVNLLMAIAPRDFPIGGEIDSVSTEGAMTVAAYGNAASGLRELGFSDGHLVMVRETGADKTVYYDVRYSDYRDIGGVVFPYVVDANFPSAHSHVIFRYARPIVNGTIPDSTFELTPAPGATMMDLSLDNADFFANQS